MIHWTAHINSALEVVAILGPMVIIIALLSCFVVYVIKRGFVE